MNKNVATILLLATALCIPVIVAKAVIVKTKAPIYYYEKPQQIQRAVPISIAPPITAPRKFVAPQKSAEVPERRFIPQIGQGGANYEQESWSYMSGQLRGQGGSRGVIIHEATHMQNSKLSRMIPGGVDQTRPQKGFAAFYFWGENQYLVTPTAGFAVSYVGPYVPLETVSRGNFDVYLGRMYANRDAIHILDDFVAELNGFEESSPALLRDMVIFSITLGYLMQNSEQYQAGNKYLIERACQKRIDLSSFRSSQSEKAVNLKNYLKTTYGPNWMAQVLGI